MELVDSKQKVLIPPEITMGALENLGLRDEVALMSLTAFLANKKTKTIQVNNTLFAYIDGEKDGVKEAVVYMYNMDAQANLHANLIKFLGMVQRRGENGVTMVSTNPDFLGAFLKIIPILKKRDARAGIFENTAKKLYMGRVTFGDMFISDKQ